MILREAKDVLPLITRPRADDSPVRGSPRVFSLDLTDADLAAGGDGKEITVGGHGVYLSELSNVNSLLEISFGESNGGQSDYMPITPGNSTPIFRTPFSSFRVRLHPKGGAVAGSAIFLVHQTDKVLPQFGVAPSDGTKEQSATGVQSAATIGVAASTPVGANAARASLTITNLGAATVYYTTGGVVATVGVGHPILSFGSKVLSAIGAISMISGAAGNDVRFDEETYG